MALFQELLHELMVFARYFSRSVNEHHCTPIRVISVVHIQIVLQKMPSITYPAKAESVTLSIQKFLRV